MQVSSLTNTCYKHQDAVGRSSSSISLPLLNPCLPSLPASPPKFKALHLSQPHVVEHLEMGWGGRKTHSMIHLEDVLLHSAVGTCDTQKLQRSFAAFRIPAHHMAIAAFCNTLPGQVFV